MLWPLHPWGNNLQYQRLGLPQCQSGHYGEERNSTSAGNLMPFAQYTRAVCSAILLTEIPQLTLQVNISKEMN